MTATVLTLPVTSTNILEQCRQAGIVLYLANGTLRFRARPGMMTQELREAVRRHKALLMSHLVSEGKFQYISCPATEGNEARVLVPSEEGKLLLEPFLLVIKAAHRTELPRVPLAWSYAGELNGYVCAVAAGIWYGVTLSEPERLAAH